MPAILAAGRRSAIKLAYSPYLDRGALSGAAAVAQMADDLRTFVANCGAVLEEDLELIGWTPQQIAAHGRAARARAYARSAG
jgi:hypothetical protein